jgi:hypothetical protein
LLGTLASNGTPLRGKQPCRSVESSLRPLKPLYEGIEATSMTHENKTHCCECAKIDSKTPGCSHRAQYSVDVQVVHDNLKDVHLCADHLAILWSALRNPVVPSAITVKGFARMHAGQ